MAAEILRVQNSNRSHYPDAVTVPYQVFANDIPSDDAGESSRGFHLQVSCVGLEPKYRRSVLEFGNTKMMVVLRGPFKCSGGSKQRGVLRCLLTYPSFASSWNSKANRAAEKRQDIMEQTRQALVASIMKSSYVGGFSFDLHYMVLQDDGCLLSTAINLGSAALAHAGVRMYGLVLCRTLLVTPDGKSVLDPTLAEENNVGRSRGVDGTGASSLTVAYIPAVDSVVLVDQQGSSFGLVGSLPDKISEVAETTKELIPHIQDVLVKDYQDNSGIPDDWMSWKQKDSK